VYRELFEEGIAQQVLKDVPLTILFALAFGPLLSVARDHILSFITLDDALSAEPSKLLGRGPEIGKVVDFFCASS